MNQTQESDLSFKSRIEVFLLQITHNSYLLANRLNGFIQEAFESNTDLEKNDCLQKIISESIIINAELTRQIADLFTFLHPEYSNLHPEYNKFPLPVGQHKIILFFLTIKNGKDMFGELFLRNKNILPQGLVEHFDRYIFPNYDSILKDLLQENPELLTIYTY